MAILCSCYMLNFCFYVQFDQFDEAKQNINIPCIISAIFYHKDPLNRNECSFSQNHYITSKAEMLISFHSIQPLYIKWNPTHYVHRNSQKFG